MFTKYLQLPKVCAKPPRHGVEPVQPLSPCSCNILLFEVISSILPSLVCKRQSPAGNLCTVNEDNPQCNVMRKAVKACLGRGLAISGALSDPHALSHIESGHAVPFSPQDFCSWCEWVYCCHSTRIPWAGICISHLTSGKLDRSSTPVNTTVRIALFFHP